MKVTRSYNHHRRDLTVDLECEACGRKIIGMSAYDDHHFWQNVIPNIPCPACRASTLDLGLEVVRVTPRYPEGVIV